MAGSRPQSNFTLLKAHDEQLVRPGLLAERYFADDPNWKKKYADLGVTELRRLKARPWKKRCTTCRCTAPLPVSMLTSTRKY